MAVRRFFAVLPDAIYGREKRSIVKKPFVNFAIRILLGIDGPEGGHFRSAEQLAKKSGNYGRKMI